MAAKSGEHGLGGVLRRERLAAGLTQEALAHAAGVDRTYVSMLENGKASPTLETLFRLCGAIGVSAAAVVAEVERAR
jgi:transcriptional regulator with XRE-family HTH domain